MKLTHTPIILLLLVAEPGQLTAQILSWVVPASIAGEPSGCAGLIEQSGNGVRAAVHSGSWESTLLTFDWQGNSTDSLTLPWVSHLRSREDGYVISGRFVGTTEIGGGTIEGGSGFGDFFLAAFDATDNLQWVTNSVSIWPNGPFVIDMAVSPSGRVGLLLNNGPRFVIEGDTIVCDHVHDWLLLSFDASGGLEWYQVLHETGLPYTLSIENTKLAMDNSERLWLATTLGSSIVVAGDTVHVVEENLFDQAILEFDQEGALLDQLVVPCGDPAGDGITCYGMIAHPDDGVLWFGNYLNGAMVDGLPLDSAGEGSNALIMHLDSLIDMQWFAVFGSDANETVTAADVDESTGTIMMAGMAGNATIIGTDTFPSEQLKYGFLMSMEPDGTIAEGHPFASTADEGTHYLIPQSLLCGNGICHLFGYSEPSSLFTTGTTIHQRNFLARFDNPETVSVSDNITSSAIPFAFPSPSDGLFSLAIDRERSLTENLRVFDAQGRLANSASIPPTAGKAQLDLRYLRPGIYFISLSSESGSRSQKIVIE